MRIIVEFAVVVDGKCDMHTYVLREYDIDECDYIEALNDPASMFDVPEDLAATGHVVVNAGI